MRQTDGRTDKQEQTRWTLLGVKTEHTHAHTHTHTCSHTHTHTCSHTHTHTHTHTVESAEQECHRDARLLPQRPAEAWWSKIWDCWSELNGTSQILFQFLTIKWDKRSDSVLSEEKWLRCDFYIYSVLVPQNLLPARSVWRAEMFGEAGCEWSYMKVYRMISNGVCVDQWKTSVFICGD